MATDDRPVPERPARLGRRAFLGSAALGAAALAAAGWTPDDASGSSPGPGRRVPFLGRHQPGVDTPAARFGLLAAFDLVSEDRGRLARTLRDLTDEARGLIEGRPSERRDSAYPPAETGILGPDLRTAGLAVTVSVGRRCSTTASGWPATGSPWTPTSAWPTRAPPRPPAAASCAAASTPPGGSTRAWPSSATRKSLTRGFLAVQARLKGEPLEEYILPVGGGFFFVLPGVPSGDGWLGQQLLA